MTRRGAWILVALGLLAYAVALLATFPAARALALADRPIEAAGVQGTMWSGSAQYADIGGPHRLTDLSWVLAGWPLLTGQMEVDADFELAGARITGRFSGAGEDSITAQDATLEGPAQALIRVLNAGPLLLEGDFLARIPEARIEQGLTRMLRGRFEWRDAALVQPVRVGLGTVTGEIQPTGDNTHEIELDATGGDAEGGGVVRLFADGRYEADLRLSPTRDAPRHIADTLSLLARRNSDGAFVLRQSGRL